MEALEKSMQRQICMVHVLGILRLHTTAHAKSVVIKQMELQQQEAVWQKEGPLQLIQVIPYGTKVIIGGHIFTAEDCGGAIKQNHIDIYVNSHEEAEALGVANASVYLVK